MKTLYTAVFILFAFVSTSNIATAKEPAINQKDICKLLKNEKGPVAFLLDEHGRVSKGPINFKRYGYSYQGCRDFYYIPTNYRIVISPARLSAPESCVTGGCLEFKKVDSVCPNSNTYSISYVKREWPQSATDRSWLPKKENDKVHVGMIEDPELDIGEPNIKFRFNLRIVGEIYDATKK